MAEVVNGIVLKTIEFNDFDLIVTIYSREYGPLSFVALGTRKIVSKNKYAVQLFSESKFEIFKSHKGRLSKLKKGYLVNSNKTISNNYFNYLLASVAADLTQQLFANNEVSKIYYRNLETLLQVLSTDQYPFKTFTFFLLQALKYQNVKLDFTTCAVCQKTINGSIYLDFKHLEVICDSCFQKLNSKDQQYFLNDPNFLETVEKIWKTDFHQLGNYYPEVEILFFLLRQILFYYKNILGIWSFAFQTLLDLPTLH